jgi:IMP dehydrogenase/GMP reductase
MSEPELTGDQRTIFVVDDDSGLVRLIEKALRGEEARNIEGEEALVPYKGSVERVVSGLLDGVRSGFSYGGAATIPELQAHAEFVEITAHGFVESLPHGK